MKKFLLSILTVFFINSASAQEMNNLSIKVDLNYQSKISKEFFTIKNDLKLSKDNHQWTVVPNNTSQSNDSLILLAKIDKLAAKSALISFIIIKNGNKPEIISRPVISAEFNKDAKMIIDEDRGRIILSVLPVYSNNG